jgi:hypothetical protein
MKNLHAQALGRAGGKKSAALLTETQHKLRMETVRKAKALKAFREKFKAILNEPPASASFHST